MTLTVTAIVGASARNAADECGVRPVSGLATLASPPSVGVRKDGDQLVLLDLSRFS